MGEKIGKDVEKTDSWIATESEEDIKWWFTYVLRLGGAFWEWILAEFKRQNPDLEPIGQAFKDYYVAHKNDILESFLVKYKPEFDSWKDRLKLDEIPVLRGKNSSTVIFQEYQWLEQKYGPMIQMEGGIWRVEFQKTFHKDGKQYDELTIRFWNGAFKKQLFDITYIFMRKRK
jgi:hypothetical protein